MVMDVLTLAFDITYDIPIYKFIFRHAGLKYRIEYSELASLL